MLRYLLDRGRAPTREGRKALANEIQAPLDASRFASDLAEDSFTVALFLLPPLRGSMALGEVVMLDRRDELDAFKREICLVEYALAHGYAVDRMASSRSSVVLVDGSGDKLVVAKAHDGHWIYFSVRDDHDNGTIIDFVQRRAGLSLGEVRKELRPWIGRPPHPAPPAAPSFWRTIQPASKDLIRVRASLENMPAVASHPYLEEVRAIPRSLLSSQRFSECVRVDKRGNAIFPHRDSDGFTGWEAKNIGFTGFAPGGAKALWTSADFEGDDSLVVAESAIDALSYATLHGAQPSRYASIAGSMNPGQPELLRDAARGLPPGSRVVIATDSDEGGDRLLEAIRQAVLPLGISTVEDRPASRGMDWNDVLLANLS